MSSYNKSNQSPWNAIRSCRGCGAACIIPAVLCGWCCCYPNFPTSIPWAKNRTERFYLCVCMCRYKVIYPSFFAFYDRAHRFVYTTLPLSSSLRISPSMPVSLPKTSSFVSFIWLLFHFSTSLHPLLPHFLFCLDSPLSFSV